MTWAEAFRGTRRQAVYFALLFLGFGLILDGFLQRDVELVQRLAMVVIAGAVFWALMAWIVRRRSQQR